MSPAKALRLAWERALAAAVLLGHAAATAPIGRGAFSLPLSQVLCQVHMSRFMLRAAHAGTGAAAFARGSPKKAAGAIGAGSRRARNKRDMCGGNDGACG